VFGNAEKGSIFAAAKQESRDAQRDVKVV